MFWDSRETRSANRAFRVRPPAVADAVGECDISAVAAPTQRDLRLRVRARSVPCGGTEPRYTESVPGRVPGSSDVAPHRLHRSSRLHRSRSDRATPCGEWSVSLSLNYRAAFSRRDHDDTPEDLSRGDNLDFSQQDMPYFRRRTAVELGRAELFD